MLKLVLKPKRAPRMRIENVQKGPQLASKSLEMMYQHSKITNYKNRSE